jgi:hypothetical protein
MFEAIKTLGIIWTAMILTHGTIAIVLVATRWTFRTLKRAPDLLLKAVSIPSVSDLKDCNHQYGRHQDRPG